MSRHWNPKSNGWAGQWDRHRWRVGGRKVRHKTRRPRSGWAGLRLMAIGGVFVGLLLSQVPLLWPTPEAGRIERISGAVSVIDGDTFDYRGMRVRLADNPGF